MLNEHRPLDLNKVHEFVIEKGKAYLEGINRGDVDWFLRGTEGNLSCDTVPETPTKKGDDETKPPSRKNLNGSLHTPASPHLTVLNTNDKCVSKTKPAITTILEEEARSSPVQEFTQSFSQQRRRSSVSSIASMNSVASNTSNGSSGGFFSKLKNKLHRTESGSSAYLSPSTSNTIPNGNSSTLTEKPLFKNNYAIRPSNDFTTPEPSALLYSSNRNTRSDGPGPSTLEESSNDDDPRLAEYVRFYKSKDKPSGRRSSLKLETNADKPSCPVPCSKPVETAAPSRIHSFFRKKSISGTDGASQSDRASSLVDISRTLTSSASTETILPEFKDLKPLKRVSFHSLTFLIDPPQQIPSRTPRKGNVDILPGGVVRVNPLTEADKLAIEKSLRGQGGGIIVGGTGALGLIEKTETEVEYDHIEANPSSGGTDRDGENDTQIDMHAKSLGIDKPMFHRVSRPGGYSVPVKKMALDVMYTRCCHLREILPIPAIAKQIPEGSMAPLPILQLRNPSPTMIEIQTFADFIRIAPIICISLDGVSMSYEQFKILLSAMCAKKNLEKLSLRNTPIDAEGWSLLCWFLSRNKALNRLDVTQCPPLSVDILKKKKKRSEKRSEDENLVRMTCNNENRSDMDWSLFTAALIARGGIEEVILTGCCITDLLVFEKLIKHALCLRTYKLSLAYNQLSPQQLRIIMTEWVLTSKSRGLDLGYNDFLSTAYMNVLCELHKSEESRKAISASKLGFLSLNATNLRFSETFKEIYENVLASLPNLKYLDMSNNPKLFGNFGAATSSDTAADSSIEIDHLLLDISEVDISAKTTYSAETIYTYFCSKLPLFKNLIRLQLEHNNLSSNALIALFEILPFCKTLAYLSIIGNSLDIYAATYLVEGLKNSSSLITVEGDYLQLPELLKEQIGLYTMRNMEHFVELSYLNGQSVEKPAGEPSLTDRLNIILLKKAESKLDLTSAEVTDFIPKVTEYRQKMRSTISDLFHLQYKNQLNMEGKEALLRLLFVDASLERGLKLIDPSLVQSVEGGNSCDLLNLRIAEDETKELKASAQSKAQDSNSSHLTFLSPLDSKALPISRTQSLTSLNNLNKEEGSALKLLLLPYETDMISQLEPYSGDEIRQKLLNINLSDLDVVIDYVNKAKDKGMSLKQIFNPLNKNSGKSENILDEIRQTVENLRRDIPGGDNTNPKEPSSTDMDLSRSSEIPADGSKGDQELSEAFDRILSKFNK